MRAVRITGLGLVFILLAWQSLVWIVAPPPYMLPSPLAVAETLVARRAFLFEQSLVTLLEIALGLLFGTLAGVAAGFAVVAWPRAGAFAWPQLLILQSMPVFALAPLLVLWFGFGLTSKVVMASLVIFFPIASAFADGLRRTDPDLLDATAMTDASPMQALWYVRMPLAMPSLVTGLRVAAPFAPLGAVIGEWVGASGGLGFVMLQANARMQTDLCFAALAILAVLTLGLRALVDEFAPRLAPWARESAVHVLPPSRQRIAS